jgi:hypothetical protein
MTACSNAGPARQEPPPAKGVGCDEGQALDEARATKAEQTQLRALRSASRSQSHLRLRWRCIPEQLEPSPNEERATLRIEPVAQHICKVEGCPPLQGDCSARFVTRVELRLETEDTAWLRRVVKADLQIRADGSVWANRVAGNLEDGALRTKLGIKPDARLQEDIFLRMMGSEPRLSVSYGSSFVTDGGVLGAGGCVLATVSEPEPLPAL